jgi:hypothetical protein
MSALETSLRDEDLSLRVRFSLARKFILPAGLAPCLPIKVNHQVAEQAIILFIGIKTPMLIIFCQKPDGSGVKNIFMLQALLRRSASFSWTLIAGGKGA